MTVPPLSSARVKTPPPVTAAARMRWTSSADEDVSTTSSRGAHCTPILTSTPLLPAAGLASAGERPAADPAPRQPGEKLLGGVLGDRPAAAEPVPGADLCHADKRHTEQMRL